MEDNAKVVMVKIEFEGKTSKTVRFLEGGDAQVWYDWIVTMCVDADTLETNPEWAGLNWQQVDALIPKKLKRKANN